MLNCFTVKKNKEQLKVSSTQSLLDSQNIKLDYLTNISWSMDEMDDQISVASATKLDKAAEASKKASNDPFAAYDYPIARANNVVFQKTQDNRPSSHNYVNSPVTLNQGSSSGSKSNGNQPPQNSPDIRVTYLFNEIRALNMSATPGDGYSSLSDGYSSLSDGYSSLSDGYSSLSDLPSVSGGSSFRSKANAIQLPQNTSEVRLTQIANNMRNVSQEINQQLEQCSPLLKPKVDTNYQSPTPLSADGTQALQKPNTATEIDKKINQRTHKTDKILPQKITTMGVDSSVGAGAVKINTYHLNQQNLIQENTFSEELNLALKQRREKIDANNQAQKTDKTLPQQMTAMGVDSSVGAGFVKINTSHCSEKNWERPLLAIGITDWANPH